MRGGTYEVPQRGVCPEHALRRDAVSGLAHVHGYCAAEEVLDFVRVGVRCYPARASDGHAAQDEGREVEERDAGEVRGEEPYDILLEANEDDTRNCPLQLRFSGCSLVEAFVHLRVGLVRFRIGVSVASTAAIRFLRGSGPLLHMGVLRRHGALLCQMSNVNRPYANLVRDEPVDLTHKEEDFACTDQCFLLSQSRSNLEKHKQKTVAGVVLEWPYGGTESTSTRTET